MKIFFFFAAVLCLTGSAFAQHLFQIDDGHGDYLLLVPPPSLSGSRTLILPMPPLTPIPAGFIGAGTATGQIPIWDNTQLAWLAATPNAALNAMLPNQTGNAGRVLFTDGTNTGWTAISAGGAISVFGRTGIVTAQTGDYNFSQISGAAVAGQLPNLQSMNGIVDIIHGGTGQITANAALNALLPSQTGNANKILQTDGINTSWAAISPGGVTSIFTRTGAVIAQANDYSFSQISGSAVAGQLPNLQSMNGIVDIIHGGTGQITANAALNTLLPAQTGNANKVLQTDGTNTTWMGLISPPVSSVFGRTGIITSAIGDYNFSQISGSATASQLPNLQNLNGLLDIAHGGTGQITANASLNAFLPAQTGNATKYLQTDGTNTSWVAVAGGGTVTSVFGRTGIVVAATNDYSFSQISGSATASQLPNLQSMNGILDITRGGTGQITANAALNALLPSQTGNGTKYLQTDGTNTSWVSVAGGGSVTGSGTSTQVAFWSSTSALSSSTNLYWDNTNSRLSIGAGSSPASALDITSSGKTINSVSSTTTDENYAVRGDATANGAGVQNIGIWGRASSNNSGNIGAIAVLANGGGNTTTGTSATPNVALQINDGEFTMGRTVENAANPTDPVGTAALTNAATAGTTYSADGPSGVVTVTVTGGLAVGNATSELAGLITINNKYAKSTSIVLVQIMDATVSAGNANRVAFGTQVLTRATGSFQVRVDAIANSTAGYTLSTYKIGYMILNPGK